MRVATPRGTRSSASARARSRASPSPFPPSTSSTSSRTASPSPRTTRPSPRASPRAWTSASTPRSRPRMRSWKKTHPPRTRRTETRSPPRATKPSTRYADASARPAATRTTRTTTSAHPKPPNARPNAHPTPPKKPQRVRPARDRPRRFPALERTIRDAIDRLGGFVAPKLTWSSPKDATWMATRKSTKCANPGEVTLLLKASDAIAHDLCDAYACCADRHSLFLSPEAERRRLRGDAELHLLAWRELNPSMEFRCFVRRGTLRGVCQRDCANFYPFLPDRVDRLTDLLAEFWQDVVYPSFPSDFSYCFDAYVTSAEKVRLVDVNPWGGATLPLMFDWSEFEDGARGVPRGANPRGRATSRRSDPGSPTTSTFASSPRGGTCGPRPRSASRSTWSTDRRTARWPPSPPRRGSERRRRGGDATMSGGSAAARSRFSRRGEGEAIL